MIDPEKLREAANRVVGRPFHFRGCAPDGFDCLGLVRWLYEQGGHPLVGLEEPDDYPQEWWRLRPMLFLEGIRKQATIFQSVISLLPGDILLFCCGAPTVTHVGVLLEADTFVHCYTGRGVMISKLGQRFWRSQFWGIARILKKEIPGG